MSGLRPDEAQDYLTVLKLDRPELTTADAATVLQRAGFSKIETIFAVHRVFKVSLGDAKELVHLNSAWAFRRQNDDDFHDALFADLDALDEEAQPAPTPFRGKEHQTTMH